MVCEPRKQSMTWMETDLILKTCALSMEDKWSCWARYELWVRCPRAGIWVVSTQSTPRARFLLDLDFVSSHQVPDVFSNSLPQEGDRMWLHTIKMTSTTNDSGLGPLRRCFSNGCCKMFGILIKNQLPSVIS